jgi:hypothetical protein
MVSLLILSWISFRFSKDYASDSMTIENAINNYGVAFSTLVFKGINKKFVALSKSITG